MRIGPSFSKELAAAGLAGLPFSWGEDGVIEFGEAITDEQREAVLAVYVAHNPDDNSVLIQAQIDAIELATLENRGSREGWIALIRERAAALGITDDALIAAENPFFKKLLLVDSQIRSLRSQLP